jgi:hypothetical protein
MLRLLSRAVRTVATLALLGGLSACEGRAEVPSSIADAGSDASHTQLPDAGPGPIESASKIDLLLVVDNTASLDLSHELLAQTLPYLLRRLVRPPCVNGLGNVVADPADVSAPCAVGVRDFAPITDFHVALVTTSLGGHGADTCSPTGPAWNPTQNDAAHLITRGPGGEVVPTYGNHGFLAWDPAQKMSPPGENDLAAVTQKMQEIVRGAGTKGCGFEAPLESAYRFLVDPQPSASIVLQNGAAVPQGIDDLLLEQRRDFLRPDSQLVVLVLTDENDCSTREGGQFYLANQSSMGSGPFHLPRARSECAKSPEGACCASCGGATPAGCPPTASDPECLKGPLTIADDPINLRCFDQKRRFGIDFLYPVDRYTKGFSEATIADAQGNVVTNPIFAGGRTPGLVVFGAIVGVPWQDVAEDPKSIAKGLLPGSEIDWSLVVGDPTTGAPPSDPLMVESIAPRMGANPPTGDALASPSAATPLANPINGHERLITEGNDLQFACIYPRPTPKDCSVDPQCDCQGADIATNPLCQAQDGSYAAIQRAHRALPGTRLLRVVQGLGAQGMAASICAANSDQPAVPTFGYKPAVDALLHTARRTLVK